MGTRKETISVRLDTEAKKRVERAARIRNQSSGAFLQMAGDEQARRVLLAWALERHRAGEASFSELAEETGLAIEEIMRAAEHPDPDESLDQFLASARSIAGATNDPGLLRVSEQAVEVVKRSLQKNGF